jgi:hypothetical protein
MTEWQDLVGPTVRKCRLAAAFNMNTTFKPDGSLALAALLEQMATVIDAEIAVRCAADVAVAVIEGTI